eukprot:TRINITY_DN2720_c0_g1::TRINITY_DN2720_c0_g1_i1::g.27614::m.27614 TRINITY_DN2720_c0_g1::TRINITY_DN2720_c0_g1_i1::g.27614  ORF type:complete len:398 (+),score=-30.16 TRINITY_DN2720_c0_g1_i1:105-1298(+)
MSFVNIALEPIQSGSSDIVEIPTQRRYDVKASDWLIPSYPWKADVHLAQLVISDRSHERCDAIRPGTIIYTAESSDRYFKRAIVLAPYTSPSSGYGAFVLPITSSEFEAGLLVDAKELKILPAPQIHSWFHHPQEDKIFEALREKINNPQINFYWTIFDVSRGDLSSVASRQVARKRVLDDYAKSLDTELKQVSFARILANYATDLPSNPDNLTDILATDAVSRYVTEFDETTVPLKRNTHKDEEATPPLMVQKRDQKKRTSIPIDKSPSKSPRKSKKSRPETRAHAHDHDHDHAPVSASAPPLDLNSLLGAALAQHAVTQSASFSHTQTSHNEAAGPSDWERVARCFRTNLRMVLLNGSGNTHCLAILENLSGELTDRQAKTFVDNEIEYLQKRTL